MKYVWMCPELIQIMFDICNIWLSLHDLLPLVKIIIRTFLCGMNWSCGNTDIWIVLSVCPSICLSYHILCMSLLLTLLYWKICHTIVLHDPRVCHDIAPRSRSQCSYSQISFPGHNSLLSCYTPPSPTKCGSWMHCFTIAVCLSVCEKMVSTR